MRKITTEIATCVILLMSLHAPGAYAAASAEIISVIGKGDRRDSAQTDWVPAAAKQSVPSGGFLRTGDMSQMAILMPDRTQMRMNQNSQMQIKTMADASEWGQSAVKLNSGRAWSQARPPSAPTGSAPPARLTMETPSATLSIRGTDWEVEVAPDGHTQLVVLSGEVDIANDQGSLKVSAGEAATAEIGKAPVRLLLANPVDRVQWVTAWQVQPRRWLATPSIAARKVIELLEVADYSAATRQIESLRADNNTEIAWELAVLQADILTFRGETQAALAQLRPYANGLKRQPVALALLARIHLARGEGEAAAELLLPAQAADPGEVEIWLASGDLALFNGDVKAARAAFGQALGLRPDNADAWFALGRIDTERENVRSARSALQAAQVARKDFSLAQAEQATLETMAGNFSAATALFEQALVLAPDSYTALSGRGLLKLKMGDSAGALVDFLRAGVMEPRFGRAWLYSAAAFYQQGETQRATEALRKAAKIDPRDPLPNVMLGLLAADALDLGGAVDMAREAQIRMPFLKSLNQVLNNQKGSANVGSALAAFGMEDWARHYAQLAYSPWWAGSHLFLADRYTGNFNKNSELFKGFITDPTVFGASQRRSSLLSVPGNHGRVDFFAERADTQQSALIGTANGLTNSPAPLAYFISGDLSAGHAADVADASHGNVVTIGLGTRPMDALGLFVFGTRTKIDGQLNNDEIPGATSSINASRLDVGANIKLAANNQIWLKTGKGNNSGLVQGSILVDTVRPLERWLDSIEQSDTQFRHALAPIDSVWLSWGYEEGRQKKSANFDIRLANLFALQEATEVQSRDAYVMARGDLSDKFRGELGLFNQRTSADRQSAQTFGLSVNSQSNQSFSENNWRGGLQWKLDGQSRLSLVGQTWRHPASVGSLGPIDTLGIAVNDRLTTMGGLYRRARLQLDLEANPDIYLQGFADHETVQNITSTLTSTVPDLKLDELVSLSNRRDAFSVQSDFEKTPDFLQGRVDTLGAVANLRLTRDHTFSVRYLHANEQQTGLREQAGKEVSFDGKHIPYLPQNMLRLTSQWSLPQRLLLGLTATWRSERYSGEANTPEQLINAGWIFGFSSYWESADKRWVLQAILDNLRRDRKASADANTKLILRASYLF